MNLQGVCAYDGQTSCGCEEPKRCAIKSSSGPSPEEVIALIWKVLGLGGGKGRT